MTGKNIIIWTERGVPLSGILFSRHGNRRILICITGIHGNPYSNPFYFPLGERLSSEGTDFIMAHVCDAYGQIPVKNRVTGRDETIGSWNEDIGNTVDDVRSYIDYAEKEGYETIYLAGHSLGANKVIYYLSRTGDSRILHYLLLSPAEVSYLREQASESEKRLVERMMAEGRGDEMLPFQLFGWIPCIACTAHQWLYDRRLDNVHSGKDGDYSQIESIQLNGAMIIGDLDSFTRGDPEGFINNINKHTVHPDRNSVRIIHMTGHTYQGEYQALCDTVSGIVGQWKEE